MAHRVFFSFHYEKDIWRASQVRNSWVTHPDRQSAGFWDAVAWEKIKRAGDLAVRAWITNQMKGTSVTVVLIGTETASREYVQYEINQSWKKHKGLIGVYIDKLRDQNGYAELKGDDPFVSLGFKGIRCYDWIDDDGRNNLGDWVKSALKRALVRRT